MNILISLIGSNPLPIYIISRYFKSNNREKEDKEILPDVDKEIFVFSESTEVYFDNIKDVLTENGFDIEEKKKHINLKNNQNRGTEIMKEIINKLKEISKSNEIKTIIINNTGGTKPMAIYATIAIQKFVKENSGIKEIECYLDAKDNKIRLISLSDESINNKYCPKNSDLRNYISDLDMNKILYLHNLKHEKNKNIKAIENIDKYCEKEVKMNPSEIMKIIEILSKDDMWIKYIECFERIECIRQISEKNNVIDLISKEFKCDLNCELEKKEGYTMLVSKNYKNSYKYIQRYLLKEESWIKELFPFIEIEEELSAKIATKMYKFLIGTWLEYYVLTVIDNVLKENNLLNEIQVYHSVECRIDKENEDAKFEIDIILLRGYQLVAITCTIADESGLTKAKAFEGLHRVEQIGGEHAKLVIINMTKNIEKLKTDLRCFNSNFYKESKILGKNIIVNYDELYQKLEEIIVE